METGYVFKRFLVTCAKYRLKFGIIIYDIYFCACTNVNKLISLSHAHISKIKAESLYII